MGNLATPVRIQKLQTALHAKAKAEPGFRFYLLYDKIYRADILAHAYCCCKANKGAAGVDEQEFADVEAYGVEPWLGELAEALRKETYRPEAVRRVYIKKPDGKLRPLGIPTLSDRVCQTAVRLVLEPIFEADLSAEQHAYRVSSNALTAVRQAHRLINTGHREVVDADLSGCFDSIPHAELMTSVARRVVDRRMLHLIKRWLVVAVEETDERRRKQSTTRNGDEKRGTPQGSPLSPLLANLYMRRFVLGWQRSSLVKGRRKQIVNYADDLVICCKQGAPKALEAMRRIMGRLKLTINEEKTRLCRVPEETFDFLGYTFGQYYSPKMGRAYIGSKPSKKSVKRLIESIRAETHRGTFQLEATQLVKGINRKLVGWANYFQLGAVSKAYRAIDTYTTARLRQWLCGKHQRSGRGNQCYPCQYLYEELGLVCLSKRTSSLPWAKA